MEGDAHPEPLHPHTFRSLKDSERWSSTHIELQCTTQCLPGIRNYSPRAKRKQGRRYPSNLKERARRVLPVIVDKFSAYLCGTWDSTVKTATFLSMVGEEGGH